LLMFSPTGSDPGFEPKFVAAASKRRIIIELSSVGLVHEFREVR